MRALEEQLPCHLFLGNYDRPTNQPANRPAKQPTDGHEVSTFKESIWKIVCTSKCYNTMPKQIHQVSEGKEGEYNIYIKNV